MKNYNVIGLGSDATKLAGYALSATGRIGPVAVVFENLGNGVYNPSSPDVTPNGASFRNTATISVGQLTSSGYTPVVNSFTIPAGGKVTKILTVHTAQLGFFGSGNTKVAITINNDQAASLRGSHIDIQPVSKTGWTVETAAPGTALFPTSTPNNTAPQGGN